MTQQYINSGFLQEKASCNVTSKSQEYKKTESIRVNQEFLEQFLSNCDKLEREQVTNVIKSLLANLKHEEKSVIFEQLTSEMSADVKASLVKRLLGDHSLQITLGQSQINTTNFFNIQSSSPDYLSDLLLSIAKTLRNS